MPVYPNFEEPPAFVPQNAARYASNAAYPSNPVLNFSNHVYREYSFVSIEFIPFSYRPRSGELKLLVQTNIVVNYITNTTGSSGTARSVISSKERALIAQAVGNPEEISNWYAQNSTNQNLPTADISFEGTFEPSELPSHTGSPVAYVIITNNTDLSGEPIVDGNMTTGDFVQKFQQYADWKTQKGTPAKVVMVDAIRENYFKM